MNLSKEERNQNGESFHIAFELLVSTAFFLSCMHSF